MPNEHAEALAEAGERMVLINSLLAVASTGIKGQWMTFKPESPEGAIMLVEATLGEPVKLNTLANMNIEITDFYAHDAGRANDDGEVEEWTRIVLFDKDRKAYSCGSRGVAKSLAVMLMAFGPAPWNPPIKATVRVQTLPGPKQWITLLPDMERFQVRASQRG